MKDLIYCQRQIPKHQWRYGFRSSAAVGCGWIATHNALRLLGYETDTQKLKVNSAHFFNQGVISFAFRINIFSTTVRDICVCFIDIHMIKEVVVHEITIALIVIC